MDSTRISKKISVVVYSYQNKVLLDYVQKVLLSSSGENSIYFYVIDQNNIDRKDVFLSKFENILSYTHVGWDNITSPIFYKEKFAKKTNADYILHLGDQVILQDKWDNYLIDACGDKNIVLSGNTIPRTYIKNNYFLSKEKIERNGLFQRTHLIDRNFIFFKKEISTKSGYPSYLKYFGEEEEHSKLIHDNGFDIYACPEEMYTDYSVPYEDLEYVPFSLTHNYNNFIENSAKDINLFLISIPAKYKRGEVFLRKLPFENNDVEYDQNKSSIDKIGGDRYLNNIREIN